MATSPEQVRTGLTVVSTAAAAELANAAASAPAEQARGLLFELTPLVVAEYGQAAAALGLEWYEELREESSASRPFTPLAVTPLREDYLASAIADATASLREIEADFQRELDESVAKLMAVAEEEVARSFRATITDNTADDPDALGWRRFARPEACKFCKMLADKGAIYTAETARFAAHGAVMSGERKGGNCMCIAGPAFGGKEIWAEATPMQYVASQKTRTPAQRERLREYLNEHFPDAPG
jgi:hypothetical protein